MTLHLALPASNCELYIKNGLSGLWTEFTLLSKVHIQWYNRLVVPFLHSFARMHAFSFIQLNFGWSKKGGTKKTSAIMSALKLPQSKGNQISWRFTYIHMCVYFSNRQS